MHPFFEQFHFFSRHGFSQRDHRHHRHAGRHHHRGFQGFGFDRGFPGDTGRGGGGLGAGRKLGSADLQLLILALLADKPHHGYEIIKALDERSKGCYSPSPGMVYPALTYLEEIGHATVETAGTKKLYSITVAGLAHLDENRAAADTLLQQLVWIGEKMDHMRRAFAGGDAPSAEAEPFADTRGGRGRRGERGRGREFGAELHRAYHLLKEALTEQPLASAAEEQRIAAILERAAAEIRGAERKA